MKSRIISPKIYYVHKANDFVGIRIDKNNIEIFVPKMFRESHYIRERNKDLLVFLKTISIAKTIENKGICSNNEDSTLMPIESYMWLINDYLENDFFYNREKRYSRDNKGKVDWKRTLHSVPIISDGNIIYDKLITSKMSPTNDIIAEIYKLCLKQSLNRIGWAFDYNIYIEIRQIKSIKEMISILQEALFSTFDDLKRIRFSHMITILENTSNENALSKFYSYGTKNYYYVFEKMVDKIFKGISGIEKKKYNPSGCWILNGEKPFLSSKLRPDTIFKRQDKTYIIDAKMYQYGATHDIEDLPNTTSLEKQITYSDFVKNYIDSNIEVRNAFILPYNKNLKVFLNDKNIVSCLRDSKNLVYIGKAIVNWRNSANLDKEDSIYAFLIDFNYLLKNYRGSSYECIEGLCKMINKLTVEHDKNILNLE